MQPTTRIKGRRARWINVPASYLNVNFEWHHRHHFVHFLLPQKCLTELTTPLFTSNKSPTTTTGRTTRSLPVRPPHESVSHRGRRRGEQAGSRYWPHNGRQGSPRRRPRSSVPPPLEVQSPLFPSFLYPFSFLPFFSRTRLLLPLLKLKLDRLFWHRAAE